MSNNKHQWTYIFVGNPSRGDDGIGPALFQQMERWLNQQYTNQTEKTDIISNNIQLIECFQLEPELCCDIENSTALMIIDASIIDSPYPCLEMLADSPQDSPQDSPVWTHAISPASLLTLFKKIYKKPPPPTYLLHIPGEQFDLGTSLSKSVEEHQIYCLSFLQQCGLANSPKDLQRIALNNTIDLSHSNPQDLENA